MSTINKKVVIKTMKQTLTNDTERGIDQEGAFSLAITYNIQHVYRFRREKIIACFSQIWAVDVYLFNALISKRTADRYIAVLPRRRWTLRHNFVSSWIFPSNLNTSSPTPHQPLLKCLVWPIYYIHINGPKVWPALCIVGQ